MPLESPVVSKVDLKLIPFLINIFKQRNSNKKVHISLLFNYLSKDRVTRTVDEVTSRGKIMDLSAISFAAPYIF